MRGFTERQPVKRLSVMFSDQSIHLLARNPGDKMTLGPASSYMHSQDFGYDGRHMAIIRTEPRNYYAIGKGLMVCPGDDTVFFPEEAMNIDITIGQPCIIPYVGVTSPVMDVLFRWKTGLSEASYLVDILVDKPCPFAALERSIERIYDTTQL